MRALIINNHTKHLSELVASFPGAIVVTKEEMGSINPEDFDVVILSGGSGVPAVLGHVDAYKDEASLIRTLKKPIIGICLGCEIICTAFGGELEFLSEKEIGQKRFEILDPSLEKALDSTLIQVYEAHMVGIKKVPKDFTVLVQSEHGPEVIKHNTLPIFGIQFHPEVEVSKKFWQWMFEKEGIR